ncbi:hypothetical protein ACTMTI_18855 [Nonomuraea sp. H19]|uniref:hypothetical protein n=1 Tax=Nonomuraea sp. H19 TaxID=3452206 RepID=UPI003F8C95E9
MSGWDNIQRAVGAADASLLGDEVLRLGAEERREAAHTRFHAAMDIWGSWPLLADQSEMISSGT